MVISISIIGIIVSTYIAVRIIIKIMKAQRKSKYTIELQRRPSNMIGEEYKMKLLKT